MTSSKASIVFLTHPFKGTPSQFNDSLKSHVDSTTNIVNSVPPIQGVDPAKIKQCLFGPNHVVFLMEDGRVCRAAIHTNLDSTSQATKETSSDEDVAPTSKKSALSTSNTDYLDVSHTLTLPTGESFNFMSSSNIAHWPNQRAATSSSSGTATSSLSSTATTLASRAITTRGRGRFIRAARGRNGAGWLSNRAVIPASAVPEELISQAQIVLQGKSRNVIIRELQKTSLDVNLAVNNLLSRDDDDPDDGDEDYIQEAYQSVDLISIFETSMPNDEPSYVTQRDFIFSDDNLYQASSYSRSEYRSSNQQGESSSTRDSDHDEVAIQMRDRWWGMLTSESKEKLSSTSKTNVASKSKKTDNLSQPKTNLVFGEVVWWRFKEESEDSVKFAHIASLHSELLAVTENGFLHYWKWCDKESPVTEIKGHCYHRALELNLTDDEHIVKIAACNVRASIVTESGKVGTWLDSTLSTVGHKLEHSLQIFTEFKNISVSKLEVCEQYSCVQLVNGLLYWWGVFPFEQRKKILDKVKTKAKKSAITGSGYIKPDIQVCIRSCPLYYPGAVGFTTVNGKPQVGELLEQAWTISEKCRFKIIESNSKKPKSNLDATSKSEPEANKVENMNTNELNTDAPIFSGSKRKINSSSNENNTFTTPSKEEEWCLRDVIFVEEVRNVPIGRVLKVDGAYALVHFSPQVIGNQSLGDSSNVDMKVLLSESRLLRKDELQIVKWTTPPKMPECFQKTPKQLHSSSASKILAFTLDKNGVHAVLKSASGLRNTLFSLASGRPAPGGHIQSEPSQFLMKGNSMSLYCTENGSLNFLKDPNNCIYPFIKDNLGGMQNPNITNILPAKTIAVKETYFTNKHSNNSQFSLILLVLKDNQIVKDILRMDSEFLLHGLKSLEGNEDGVNEVATIKCDGNRNLLHICVSTGKPLTPKQAKLMNTMKTLGIPSPDKSDGAKDGFHSAMWDLSYDGLTCLDILLNNCILTKHVKQLLLEKDAFGCTPFMSAALVKAYPAASKLYQAAKKCATDNDGVLNKDLFMSMICPPGTDANLSPLQVLCYNDTCSFTWTGTRHINQDIFECKTCGLVGPLCCCTECAQVCHIGHECKLKHTSPTAYCDCWQKCPCKSLVGGDQVEREALFHKLVEETELCTKPNKKGQHILLFLAITVARQSSEQTQYVPSRIPSATESKSRSGSSLPSRRVRGQSPPIDHELEPPQFAKMSLSYMLKTWLAVKSAVLFGDNQNNSQRVFSLDENVLNASLLHADDMIKHLNSQTGTLHLDNLMHKLITKCNSEFLDCLIQTLNQRVSQTKEASASSEDNPDYKEAILVAKRVVHSVIRIYTILSGCTTSAKRKLVLPSISRCKRVFIALNFISAPELAAVASSILAPVRMGVSFPCSPFMLGSSAESISACDEFFTMNPIPSRAPNVVNSSTQEQQLRVRFVDDVSGNNEEMEIENASHSQSATESQTFGSQGTETDETMDLMAESDSDSDESTQGDTVGGNAANEISSSSQGRGRGDGYFSTTSETEGEDDDIMDEEEEDEDEEDDDDEENNGNFSSEHRSTTTSSRDNSTPHALQWAFRNRTNHSATSATTTPSSGTSSLYSESSQARRSGGAASVEGASSTTTYNTPSALARTFSVLVSEVSDILSSANDMNLSGNQRQHMKNAKELADHHLKVTWQWLWNVMEVTESQLKFGASITAVSDPNHPQHPLYDQQNNKNAKPAARSTSSFNGGGSVRASENRRKKRAVSSQSLTSDANSGRQEYLAYLLSLMRSQESEHGDSLPKIDVASLRHVAFVLDAFIYYLRTTQELNFSEENQAQSFSPALTSLSPYESNDSSNQISSNEFRVTSTNSSSNLMKSDMEEEDDGEITDDQDNVPMEEYAAVDAKILRQSFFRRSDSTLVLGHEPADPFTTSFREALPLADRPQLLTPTSRREQLFGTTKSRDKDNSPNPCLSMNLNSNTATNEENNLDFSKLSPNTFLGRWNMCLELFCLVFLDDVGAEPNSVLNELGRFDVKEAKFKRDMEKLKIGHQKDLFLENLDRDRNVLMQQTLRQLNAQFGRRLPGAGPLSIHLLKVSFKDELGEGLGVVRSFFTAIGNAFLSDQKLPNLENIFLGSRGLTSQLRARAKERERDRRRMTTSSLSAGLIPRVIRRNERSSSDRTATELENCILSLDAPPYTPPSLGESEDGEEEYVNGPLSHHKREMARRIYRKVNNTWPEHASKITGMLLEFTPTQLVYLLTHDTVLKDKMNEAAEMIIASYADSLTSLQDSASNSSNSQQKNSSNNLLDTNKRELNLMDEDEADNSPLFYQPGKPGYYSPVPGKCSPERLNCFRNVGRVIGLCFLMNDISPMSFNRHVIKYLLGRRVHWHDLAFFDPTLYESLRQLIVDSNRSDHQEIFNSLGLNYSIQLGPEEGGNVVDLISGGSQVEVAADNVHDYVKRYAEYRMIGNSRRALQAMRRGLLDVVPHHHLDGLTAEDFRLLLNGAGNINIRQLMSYTAYSNETGGEDPEKINKFKKWFVSMLENMTMRQKQDLLYFWTASPAMPASAEGYQPLPSIMLKPANDHQLPTANTCISRLYVPLYSSKSILKSKFLMAIKTKNFGFI